MPTSFAVRPLLCALALGAALATPSWAAPESAPDEAFSQAFATFMQAQSGSRGAISPASEQFRLLALAQPSNPVVLAYRGAATTLQATNTVLPWKKMRFAEDGLAMLDKALAMPQAQQTTSLQRSVPAVLEVRFVAANTFLAVPSFMQRQARGAQLLGEVLQHPALAQAPLEFRGAVWLRAAQWALEEKRSADAQRWLDLVLQSHAPQAPEAMVLRASLQG